MRLPSTARSVAKLENTECPKGKFWTAEKGGREGNRKKKKKERRVGTVPRTITISIPLMGNKKW